EYAYIVFGGFLVLIGVYVGLVDVVDSRHPTDTGIVKTFKQPAGFFEEYDGKDRARWGWGWGISPGKTHMTILLVLGEPKRLEARTVRIFIGWLGLPNQLLPQFF
ncbi:MAG: hypothetical protein LZ173_04060, partial [Thaumarchaeota archaeon]|nr:hypothetical protein [Candidatus Geocrenenecus arthurdayi]